MQTLVTMTKFIIKIKTSFELYKIIHLCTNMIINIITVVKLNNTMKNINTTIVMQYYAYNYDQFRHVFNKNFFDVFPSANYIISSVNHIHFSYLVCNSCKVEIVFTISDLVFFPIQHLVIVIVI